MICGRYYRFHFSLHFTHFYINFTFSVNVDDAVEDIVRQFKEVSNGMMHKVVGPTTSCSEYSNSITGRNLSLHSDEFDTKISRQSTAETSTSISDNEEGAKDRNHGPKVNGWHSDRRPQAVKCDMESANLGSDRRDIVGGKSDQMVQNTHMVVSYPAGPDQWGDPNGMPPEVGFCLLKCH